MTAISLHFKADVRFLIFIRSTHLNSLCVEGKGHRNFKIGPQFLHVGLNSYCNYYLSLVGIVLFRWQINVTGTKN